MGLRLLNYSLANSKISCNCLTTFDAAGTRLTDNLLKKVISKNPNLINLNISST